MGDQADKTLESWRSSIVNPMYVEVSVSEKSG